MELRSAQPIRLSELKVGDSAVVRSITLPDDECRRMNVLGIAIGTSVDVIRKAPGGDPTLYHVDGTDLALRRDAADQVMVLPLRSTYSSKGEQ